MAMTMAQASAAMREAMRETIKRYSTWYLLEGVLLVIAGVGWFTLADRSLVHRLELQIGVFCAGLFLACMFCHGELARLKPAPRHLTRFYLMVSLGGAVGSALVGLLAPIVLPAYFELGFGLAACAALLVKRLKGFAGR